MVDPPPKQSEMRRARGVSFHPTWSLMATRGVTIPLELAWIEELGYFDIVFAV